MTQLPGGSVLAYLIDLIPGVRLHKASKMLDQLLDLVSLRPGELVDRLRKDSRLSQLVWTATYAAAESELEAKIHGLARAAAEAILDEARIDESRLIVRTLAQMEVLHVRALRVLRNRPTGGIEENNIPLEDLLKIAPPVAEAVAEDLKRLALAEMTGMSFRGVGTALWRSPYGQRVLCYLEQRADVPEPG